MAITLFNILAKFLLWIKNRKLSNIKMPIGNDLLPLNLKEVPRYLRMIAILLQLTNSQTSELLRLGLRFEQL